jgi:hypothetical protein
MQKNTIRKALLSMFFTIAISGGLRAQCCGGGGGSPVAGGSSQGVLNENQMEINTNLQYIHTTKFFSGDNRDTNYLDSYSSSYLYTRLAYGLLKKFTISLEAGYWLDKNEVGKNKSVTYKSSGIGDIIIFPRYNILNIEKNHKRTEITVGMGFKIPLGSYQDSSEMIEPFSGDSYYITKPLSVQTSSGSQDFIFYAFLSRTYSFYDFRVFANALYVKKGYNPIGEKMGDYASVGLFAGKTFFKKLAITMQLKAEWISKMKLNETIREYDYPNYDPEATGSKKLFVVPQLSYNYKGFVIYALSEIPVYQYVTKTQIASEFQTTIGLSYRFMCKKACEVEPVK